MVHLAAGSKASLRKALISWLRSQLSLRLHWVLDQTMIKADRVDLVIEFSNMVRQGEFCLIVTLFDIRISFEINNSKDREF